MKPVWGGEVMNNQDRCHRVRWVDGNVVEDIVEHPCPAVRVKRRSLRHITVYSDESAEEAKLTLLRESMRHIRNLDTRIQDAITNHAMVEAVLRAKGGIPNYKTSIHQEALRLLDA
jgi:hypothetical protein